MSKYSGTVSRGIKLPIIREGDDVRKIVVDTLLEASNAGEFFFQDKDVIAITESLVARAEGNYVEIDDVAEHIKNLLGDPDVIEVVDPIYSRNRFSLILKAIAKAAGSKVIISMPPFDEVGNPRGVNPFTNVNMKEYYRYLVEAESKECDIQYYQVYREGTVAIYCGLHDYAEWKREWKKKFPKNKFITLADIESDKCAYGLLGSNKATETKLKLFPSQKFSQKLVKDIQKDILKATGKKVEVMIYGDGCFKDPVGGIWEFADPVVSPAYTDGLEGTPNELKFKYIVDNAQEKLSEEQLKQLIHEKDHDLKGNMKSEGTTPRHLTDLIGSLCDLTSGSGDKGTPVVLVQGYFSNFAD